MYHHSGSVAQPAVDTTAGLLERQAADRAEVLAFQRCSWCGTAMYHRLLCPACQGSDLRTEYSTGVGTVRHSTTLRRNTPTVRNVSLIEMAERFVVRGSVMNPRIGICSGDRVRLYTVRDPVLGEPVFEFADEPFRAWT